MALSVVIFWSRQDCILLEALAREVTSGSPEELGMLMVG